MDKNQLEEIKARAAAATPGPWNVGNGDDESWFCGMESVVSKLRVVANRAVYGAGREFDRQTYKDMVFIANSRTDIPTLVAEVERQIQRADEWRSIAAEWQEKALNAENEIATLKGALERACEEIANRVVEKAGAPTALFKDEIKETLMEQYTEQAQKEATP